MTMDNGFAVHAARRALGIVLVFLLPALLAGCLQMERIVRINTDGSGILIERLVMSHEMLEMAGGMQPEGQTFNVRNDEELREAAATYGESVRFLSASDVETAFGKGYEARYAFDDINSLRINQNKVSAKTPGAAGDGDDGKEPKFTTFAMRGGDPADLTIYWPVDSAESDGKEDDIEEISKEAPTPEEEEMAMEMMKTMFQGMRLAMHIEVVGDIVETNATHLSGSRITLTDVDLGELFSNVEAVRALGGKRPDSLEDMQKLMQLFPGMKIEIQPEVAVRFQ